MEIPQSPEVKEVPAVEVTSKKHLFTYLVLLLLVVLPLAGFFVGNQFGSRQVSTAEVVEEENQESASVADQTTATMTSEWGLSVEGSSDGILPLNTDELIQEALKSYVNQKLATVAVFETPESSAQIAVATNRENGGVFCGYDSGPCYLFLKAYVQGYPRVKYIGSIESKGVVDFSTVKFNSPTVFEVTSRWGDAGYTATRVISFDITTGSSTVVSVETTNPE